MLNLKQVCTSACARVCVCVCPCEVRYKKVRHKKTVPLWENLGKKADSLSRQRGVHDGYYTHSLTPASVHINNTKKGIAVEKTRINDTKQWGLHITSGSYGASQTQRKTHRVQGCQQLIDFKWKSVAATSKPNGTQNVRQMSFNLYCCSLFHQINGYLCWWAHCGVVLRYLSFNLEDKGKKWKFVITVIDFFFSSPVQTVWQSEYRVVGYLLKPQGFLKGSSSMQDDARDEKSFVLLLIKLLSVAKRERGGKNMDLWQLARNASLFPRKRQQESIFSHTVLFIIEFCRGSSVFLSIQYLWLIICKNH